MQSKYGFPIEMESGAEGFFTDFILKLAEKGSERSEKEARERAKNRKYEPSDLEKLVKQHSSKLMKEVKPYGTKIAKMLPKSKEFKTLFNNIKKETIRDYGKEDWEMIEDDLYYFECNPELYDSNISVLSFSQDLMSYDGWDEFESLMVSEFNKIANKLKAPSGYKWIFTGPFDDETSIWCTLEETSTVGNESFNLFNDNYPLNITMDTLFNNIKDTFNVNKNYPWASPEAAIESTLDQMTGYEFSKYIENMEVEYEGTEGLISGVKSVIKWFINLIKKFFNWITGRNKKEEKKLKELNAALKLQIHSLQKSTGIKQKQDSEKIKRLEDEIEKLKDRLNKNVNSEKSSKDEINRIQARIKEYDEKLRKEKETSSNLKAKLQKMSQSNASKTINKQNETTETDTPSQTNTPQYWAPTGIDFDKSIEIMEIVEKTFDELCSVMLGAYNWDTCIERLEKSSLNNKFIDHKYAYDIRIKLDELEKNLNMIKAIPYSSKNDAIKIIENYKQYYSRYKSFKEHVSKNISTVHSSLRSLSYDNSYNLKKHNTKNDHETKSNITVFIKIIYPRFEDNHSKLITKICEVVYDCYYKNKES